MADGRHTCRRTGTKIAVAQLDHQGKIPDKFRKILIYRLGGDAITRFQQCKLEGIRKMADGGHNCRRNGTKIKGAQLDYQGNILKQASKNSEQWSRRRCDNEKMFTDVWIDRRMDAGQPPVK